MKKRRNLKLHIVAVLLLLLALTAVCGTISLLMTQTDSVTNTFTPAKVDCEVTENFASNKKTDVVVENTGDAPCYIRVKLLPYWYDKENDVIVAKSAWTPTFTPEEGWELGSDGFWYYTQPVSVGGSTTELIPETTLGIDDVTLARQVLEIIASCIQAEPTDAVTAAWSDTNGSVTGVNANGTLIVATQGG